MKKKIVKKDDGGEIGGGPTYNFKNVPNPTAQDSATYRGSYSIAQQMSPMGFKKEFLDPYMNASKNKGAMSTSPEYMQALQRNYYIALNAWQDAHSSNLEKKEDGGPTDGQQPPPKYKTLQTANVNAGAIRTDNPNDPRVQRYKDSMALYNYSQEFRKRFSEAKATGDANNYAGNKAFNKWIDETDHTITDPWARLTQYNGGEPGKRLFNESKELTLSRDGDNTHNIQIYPTEWVKPTQPVLYSPNPPMNKTQIQTPTQLAGNVPQVEPPTGGTGQLAGGPSNFSFTGRDDQGQQTTRYFPDLASWTNATNTMGYSNREVINNGQQANATGYQFKDGGMKVKLTKADLGLSMPTSPLAQIGQGPAPIQAPQMYQTPGFASSTNMQSTQQNNPNIPNGGGDINWDHVMASYVAQNLASGMVSRFSPNSQQNNMKEFNKQQFSPMNFLPYTQNNSVQAQFGTPQMRQGGQVMSDGGYFGGSDDEMRKWILGEDEPTNDTPDAPQQQEQTPQYNDDAMQFATFVQMMGLDQADREKSPEDQGEGNMYGHGGPVTDGELYEILGDEASDEHLDKLAKGGWIQKASASIKRRGTKGVCTGSKFGGPSCRPGTRRYALAKTFKHMAHKRKKHEDGGLVGPDEMDLSPETIIGLIGQGYQFDV